MKASNTGGGPTSRICLPQYRLPLLPHLLQRNKSEAMSRLKISMQKCFVNDGAGDFRGQMQLSREITTPMAHIKNRKYLRSDTIHVSLFHIATIPAIH
jgi:hypothetical protein